MHWFQFAAEPGRLAEMGRRARRRMEERFDSRLYAPWMLELYHAALKLSPDDRCGSQTRVSWVEQ
jgi:hypothetical protein